MNRGSDEPLELVISHRRASMRPRFMNRGSLHRPRRTRGTRRRFNEAPIHESGKSRSDAPQGVIMPELQ